MSGFTKVVNVGGKYEKTIFSNVLKLKSNKLEIIYDEVVAKIKEYEEYEGYEEVDEHKKELQKVKLEIEELSHKINSIVNSLRG